MKAISGKALRKVAEQNGWELKQITGSNHIYSKTGVDTIPVIPVHGNRDLPTGTLKSILKDAELTEEDL